MKKRIKPTAKKTKRKNAFKKLEQKVKRDLGNQVEGVVYNPPGEIKMSDALENVIEPYTDEMGTIEAMRKLVAIGAMAWNLALLPSESVATELSRMVKGMTIEQDNAATLTELITKMIERKRLLYPDVNRFIVNFQVEDIGDGWHISVASTLSSKDQ